MMMNVLQAFGLVALGMAVEWLHNKIAWLKYYEGKREGQGYENKRKVR
jgi:hypothetical protein